MSDCDNILRDILSVKTGWSRCNILICSCSSAHTCHTQMECPFVYVPGLFSTPFSIHCATQGCTGMEQVFKFAHAWWWNMVQMKMLHRVWIFFSRYLHSLHRDRRHNPCHSNNLSLPPFSCTKLCRHRVYPPRLFALLNRFKECNRNLHKNIKI